MKRSIGSVGIAGCGRMGPELFLLFESCGFRTTLYGRRREAVEERRIEFLKTLDFSLEEEVIDEEEFARRKDAASFVTDPAALAGCDLVLEAISESATKKKDLFAAIQRSAPQDVIFASCSSSITPSEIAPSPARLARTFGLHFFSPPKFVGVVEVIKPASADPDALDRIIDMLEILDRSHLLEAEDEPFMVNRCLLPMQAQAYRFVEEGRAGFTQMDRLVRDNLMMLGVFEMFDRIGIDIAYPSVARYIRMQNDLADFARPLENALKRLAEAGRTGVKKGGGFLEWKDGKTAGAGEALPEDACEAMKRSLRLALVNQLYYFVEKRAVLESDLASALSEAFGLQLGIMEWMSGKDMEDIGSELESIYRQTGNPVFKPRAPLLNAGSDPDSSGGAAGPAADGED